MVFDDYIVATNTEEFSDDVAVSDDVMIKFVYILQKTAIRY